MAHTESLPTPKTYWLIALALAVVTAVEIVIAYINQSAAVIGTMLVVLGAIKFGVVVAFFMHLKFEKPLMRSLFLIGVFGSIVLFVVVLATFRAL